jgi:SAM-dependent methyltransferase
MTASELKYDGHDLEALFELKNYQKWIAESFAPYLTGFVTEFGAGIGAMSQWLVPMADHTDLVEPSANLIGPLEKRFEGDRRVRVINKSLQDYVNEQDRQSLDAAVMVNLLEHIEEDTTALSSLKALLKPAGHLLVFVPAMPALYSKLDRIVGHHRRYSRNQLLSVATKAGYEVLTLHYFDCLGIIPWWLVNTIAGKTSFDPRLSQLYDRIGVPITRSLERVVAPPLGKNLLLVARPKRFVNH